MIKNIFEYRRTFLCFASLMSYKEKFAYNKSSKTNTSPISNTEMGQIGKLPFLRVYILNQSRVKQNYTIQL